MNPPQVQPWKRTDKQGELCELINGPQSNTAAWGGSGSAKSFFFMYAMMVRAMRFKSMHCICRDLQVDVRQKVAISMWPEVMDICFPGMWDVRDMNKSDWFYTFPNTGSIVWFYGLDKDDKILGPSYSTMLFEECSQMDWESVEDAHSRIRQKNGLTNRAWYTFNPPKKSHWTYKVFILKQNPVEKKPLEHPDDWASIKMNPRDNLENLGEGYIKRLEGMSKRKRKRFLDGEFAEDDEGLLFEPSWIDRHRVSKADMPDEFDRVAIGVDPAVSTNRRSDLTGIICVGLKDGHCYVLEDCTGKHTAKQWSDKVRYLWDKWQATAVVGERNRGGDLVKENIVRNNPYLWVEEVTATKGKFTRAEPVAALYERGLVHHTEGLDELEDELCEYNPDSLKRSPNRLDGTAWAIHYLVIKDRIINPNVGVDGDDTIDPDDMTEGERAEAYAEYVDDPEIWD